MSNFPELIQNLFSPNSEIRKQSESQIDLLASNSTQQFYSGLLELMQTNPNFVQICVVLIKKYSMYLNSQDINQNFAICDSLFKIAPKVNKVTLFQIEDVLNDLLMTFFDNEKVLLILQKEREVFSSATVKDLAIYLLISSHFVNANMSEEIIEMMKKMVETNDLELIQVVVRSIHNTNNFYKNDERIFAIMEGVIISTVKVLLSKTNDIN